VAGIGAHHFFRWRDGELVERLTTPYGLVGLLEDRDGSILLGSWTGELLRVSGGRLESVAYPGRHGHETMRPVLAGRSATWFAVGADKLLELREGAFVWHRLGGLGVGSEVLSGVEDARGDLWFTTEHNGLLRVSDLGLERFGTSNGLPTEDLTQIAVGGGGTLWIGTRARGLLQLRAGRFATIDARHGLPEGGISAVVPTPSGWLWLSTPEHGIVRMREADVTRAAEGAQGALRVVRYGASDGLPASGGAWWSPPAGAFDRSGRVWFGLKHQAVAFSSVAGLASLPQPVPLIAAVRLDGERLAAGAALVAPSSGILEVRFGSQLMEGREQVEHRFRLDGVDRDWRPAGESTEAVYGHLAPGPYTFHLAARRMDRSDEAVAVTAHSFLVLAPWYQRTSVRLAGVAGLLLGLLALAYVTFVVRVRGVQLRLLAIEEERLRISRDMHDSLAQTLYAARLQVEAADRGASGSSPPALARAAALITRAMDETRAAVWSLRAGPFGTRDLPTAISLTARELLGERDLSLHIEAKGAPYRLPRDTEWHLGQIFREALTNALKHGDPRSVRVGMEFLPDWFRLKIADDGRGLSSSPDGGAGSGGHFGLQNMRERLAQLGGRLQLDSEPTAGTTVSLELPRSATPRTT
jgi:signal transduction histidine kinase